MPTYAYACKDCTHEFDIVQSFSDDSLTVCPQCEGRLRKKFNSVGISFKGSGFYRNDSRSESGASSSLSATSDSSNTSSTAESSGSSSDSSSTSESSTSSAPAKTSASSTSSVSSSD